MARTLSVVSLVLIVALAATTAACHEHHRDHDRDHHEPGHGSDPVPPRRTSPTRGKGGKGSAEATKPPVMTLPTRPSGGGQTPVVVPAGILRDRAAIADPMIPIVIPRKPSGGAADGARKMRKQDIAEGIDLVGMVAEQAADGKTRVVAVDPVRNPMVGDDGAGININNDNNGGADTNVDNNNNNGNVDTGISNNNNGAAETNMNNNNNNKQYNTEINIFEEEGDGHHKHHHHGGQHGKRGGRLNEQPMDADVMDENGIDGSWSLSRSHGGHHHHHMRSRHMQCIIHALAFIGAITVLVGAVRLCKCVCARCCRGCRAAPQQQPQVIPVAVVVDVDMAEKPAKGVVVAESMEIV